MDRLRSKERQIIDWFKQNFCGRINLACSSWTGWKSLINSFFESCDTIKQQYSRKGQLEIVGEIDAIGPTLVKNIVKIIEDSSSFPVSKFYKNKTLQFVQLAFEDYVVVTGGGSTYSKLRTGFNAKNHHQREGAPPIDFSWQIRISGLPGGL